VSVIEEDRSTVSLPHHAGPAMTARRGLWLTGLALAIVGGLAWAAEVPPGDEGYRAGWRAWVARQYDEALAALERAVEADPRNVAYRESLGHMAYKRRKQRDAESQLERAQRLSPKEPRIAYLLAQMYGLRFTGDPEQYEKMRQQTFEFYQRTITLDPDNGFPQAQYASVLFDAGRDEEAIKALDAAIAAKSFRLYLMPTPTAREPAEGGIFWAASLDLLSPALARFNNLASRCRRRSAMATAAGDMEQAKADLTRGAALGRRVAAMEPKLLTAALFGIRIEVRARRGLAEVVRASGDAAAADKVIARADTLETVADDTAAEARKWGEQPLPPAEDLRERETKLVEKALRLAYP